MPSFIIEPRPYETGKTTIDPAVMRLPRQSRISSKWGALGFTGFGNAVLCFLIEGVHRIAAQAILAMRLACICVYGAAKTALPNSYYHAATA